MKKNKKFKVRILIIGLVFTLLYFSIQFGDINLSINDGIIGKKGITPNLSDRKSASIEWYRILGGVNWDVGYGVAVDSSNNVYLVGGTYSFGAGESDIILVKYNENGTQQWNRTWGGANFEGSYGVTVDSLDNVYLVGGTYSFGAGESDIILVKYNGDGTQQWNCTWGGINDDRGWGVSVDSSDNVYIAGSTESFGLVRYDMVLVKYDGNGVQQWNCTWGGSMDDLGYAAVVDSLDNIYLTGSTRSFGAGYNDMVLVKYDGNGMQQWNCTWGGANSDYDNGVIVDSLDNVYLVGETYSFGAGESDMVLVKYDGNGVQKWNRTWGEDDYDHGWGVALDSLDNVYVTGSTRSFGAGENDMVLVKYDENGRQQWYRIWGGADYEESFGVAVDSLDNVYLVGSTDSYGAGNFDMVLVKYIYVERPPSDEFIMIVIIILSIASLVGVGITITFLIRKKQQIVE